MKKLLIGTDWRTDCIDNGNSIRACRAKGQSFRAPALVICAPKTSRKTGKKAPSGKDDAVLKDYFFLFASA